MEPQGHFWSDDVDKMSWAEAVPALKNSDVALWAIIGKPEDFSRDKTRFGLSLLTIAAAARRRGYIPILIIGTDGRITLESLPLMLRGADNIQLGRKSSFICFPSLIVSRSLTYIPA